MTLHVAASPTIIILTILEVSFRLPENICSTVLTHDDCHRMFYDTGNMIIKFFLFESSSLPTSTATTWPSPASPTSSRRCLRRSTSTPETWWSTRTCAAAGSSFRWPSHKTSYSLSLMKGHNKPGSVISNGREPKSCLGRVFNSKLGHIAILRRKCLAWHAATSRVGNSAQGSSCQLKFVRE